MEAIARPRAGKVQPTHARDGGQEVLLGVDGGRRVERVPVGDDGLDEGWRRALLWWWVESYEHVVVDVFGDVLEDVHVVG